MSVSLRWWLAGFALLVTGFPGAALAQGNSQAGMGVQQQLNALDTRVETLEGEVAGLAGETTLSDLDCTNFATIPGPLAIFRNGQWECAEFEFARETQVLPPGTREAFLVVSCPAGTLPISGGASATRFVPPAGGGLVMTQNGPGPSFNQWSAGWVSTLTTGTALETQLSLLVQCL